jgi:TRAP-type transport system small permease protein
MIRTIEIATNIAAGLILLFACLLTLADVSGRNLFGRPISGATELTELALVGMTFLIYPRLAYRQQHIVIDLLDFMMGPLMRRLQQILAGVLGAILFFAIGWRLWILATRSANFGDVTAYLRIPLSPILTFMSVFSLLTAAAFAGTALYALFAPRRRFLQPPGEPHRVAD